MSLLSVERVKSELRIDGVDHDARLADLVDEAVDYIQKFRSDTITELSAIDKRLVYLYVAIQFDGADLWPAFDQLLELVREK